MRPLRINILFVISIYIACEITANATAGKVTLLGPLTVPAAIYIYALSFTIIDIINETMGRVGARKVVLAAFVANAIFAVYSSIAASLPSPLWFSASYTYNAVFVHSTRIVIASLIAYLVSALLDVEVYSKLRKIVAPGARVLFSNAASTLVDSAIFITLAFGNSQATPWIVIPSLILGQYVVKMAVTVVSIPLIYLVKGATRVTNNA